MCAQAGGIRTSEQLQAINTRAQLWHVPWAPSEERDAASINPHLAALLREVAIQDEVVIAVSNSNLAGDGGPLQHWCAARPF